MGAGRKVFDLALTELGPYSLAFTRSGRFLALAGRKGHLAVLDWQRRQLACEVQVREGRGSGGGWGGAGARCLLDWQRRQ